MYLEYYMDRSLIMWQQVCWIENISNSKCNTIHDDCWPSFIDPFTHSYSSWSMRSKKTSFPTWTINEEEHTEQEESISSSNQFLPSKNSKKIAKNDEKTRFYNLSSYVGIQIFQPLKHCRWFCASSLPYTYRYLTENSIPTRNKIRPYSSTQQHPSIPHFFYKSLVQPIVLIYSGYFYDGNRIK